MPRIPRLELVALICAAFVLVAASARAETFEAPVGGKALPVGAARVVCPGTSGDWAIESDGHALRPPAADSAAGTSVEAKVAATTAACATAASPLTLVATGRWPALDPGATTLFVDEGRVEIGGHGLRGLIVRWSVADKSGEDRCDRPRAEAGAERCDIAVGHGLPANPSSESLRWRPAASPRAPDVTLFDPSGRPVGPDDLILRPARVVISTLVRPDVSIDLAGGTASRVPLVHPEAVADVDCGAVSCDVSSQGIAIGGLSSLASALSIRARLAPGVFVRHGDGLDGASVISVPVLPCAMSLASGEAPRDVDATRAVVRVDGRCAAEARELRWFSAGRPLDVLGVLDSGGASFVLLGVGRIDTDELVVTAVRGGADGSTVGQARAPTRPAPLPHSALALDSDDNIDFVPTNRPAMAHWARAQGAGVLSLVGVDGVYSVTRGEDTVQVQGEPGSGGLVALRFAWRVSSLPGSLATVDLALVSDPVLRPMHEAPITVPLHPRDGRAPLVELVCGSGGATQAIVPGSAAHVSYDLRDACRIVLHGERMQRDQGAQHLQLNVDVIGVDGTSRPDAHIADPIVLRPGHDPRILWIKGVQGPFDRATIRIAHIGDSRADDRQHEESSVQWALVFGTAHFRLYATTAIPTGLYRVSDRAHSGILSLNLAVVMRATWLDPDGHEGVLGLEGGVLAEGLANDVDASGHTLTQVAAVTGVGLSVPIANRSLATETSINLHAWFEYEVSRDLGSQPGSPLGFVFGPSISIGNVGTNL